MHIHRPKPLHGWRELLGEIGVIVVGIVIALGGEQAIEALHWGHQVDAGKAVLKREFAREVRNAAQREAQSACITQRLAFLSSVVGHAAESGRLPPIGAIGHPPYTPWTLEAWDALVASQTVSHLSRSHVETYSAIARMAAFLSATSDQEDDQWTLLNSMEGPGRRLSDAEAEQLRMTLAEASASNRHMGNTSERLREVVMATELVDRAYAAAVSARADREDRTTAICQPMTPPSPAPAATLANAEKRAPTLKSGSRARRGDDG